MRVSVDTQTNSRLHRIAALPTLAQQGEPQVEVAAREASRALERHCAGGARLELHRRLRRMVNRRSSFLTSDAGSLHERINLGRREASSKQSPAISLIPFSILRARLTGALVCVGGPTEPRRSRASPFFFTLRWTCSRSVLSGVPTLPLGSTLGGFSLVGESKTIASNAACAPPV